MWSTQQGDMLINLRRFEKKSAIQSITKFASCLYFVVDALSFPIRVYQSMISCESYTKTTKCGAGFATVEDDCSNIYHLIM